MQTQIPIVARGRTERASGIEDAEFRSRVARLQDGMRERGLDWLVCCGDRREYAPSCYLSGLVPRERWGAVIVHREGEPELYVGVPSDRDIPLMRRLTWMEDVRLLALLEDRVGALGGHGGVAAPADMASGALRGLARAGAREPALDLVDDAMSVSSPGERALLRRAATIAALGARHAGQALEAGASPNDALIAAELAARRAGGHDVRILAGESRLGLRTGVPATAPAFSYLIAVELEGYWGEALRTAGAPTADDGGDVTTVRLGLSIGPTGAAPVADGIYSLRSHTVGHWHSHTIELTAGRSEVVA